MTRAARCETLRVASDRSGNGGVHVGIAGERARLVFPACDSAAYYRLKLILKGAGHAVPADAALSVALPSFLRTASLIRSQTRNGRRDFLDMGSLGVHPLDRGIILLIRLTASRGIALDPGNVLDYLAFVYRYFIGRKRDRARLVEHMEFATVGGLRRWIDQPLKVEAEREDGAFVCSGLIFENNRLALARFTIEPRGAVTVEIAGGLSF